MRGNGIITNVNFLDRKAYDWGSAFARGLFWLFPRRKRIAVENILKAGITGDPKEARRIASDDGCEDITSVRRAHFLRRLFAWILIAALVVAGIVVVFRYF